MAKKSAGASEINGFISINNDKGKNTTKTSTTKKTTTMASKSTVRSDNLKAPKDLPSTKLTAKKINPTDKLTKTVTPVASTAPRESKATVGISKSGTSSKNAITSKAPARRPATNQKTVEEKSPTGKTTIRPTTMVVPKTSKTTTKKDLPKTKDSQVTSKAKDTAVKTTASRASKLVVEKKNTSSKSSIDKHAVSQKQPVLSRQKQISKAQPQTSKLNSTNVLTSQTAETKVLGKNGLAYNVLLEPAKSAKPESLAQNDRSRSVDNQKSKNSPTPLVKQRTFVKDQDEELKSSLPHISDRDESVSKDCEDYEEYESDFEDATETETSVSEASKALPAQIVESLPSTSKHQSLQSKEETLLDGISSAVSKESISAKSIESSKTVESSAQRTGDEKIVETSVYDYEDDFEDYSSDFEEDTESGFTSSNETTSETSETSSSVENEVLTSDAKVGSKTKVVVEEERKLDSGNYDLKTSALRSEAMRLNQLNDIKEAISRENTMFKEELSSEKVVSSPTIQIMDFKAAVDQAEKKSKRDPLRGKLLMNMIKLHSMDYHLFEMQPLPYEDFIQLRGNLNFQQEQTQTREDDIWEETQTDEIALSNKWTQWPVSYHSWAGAEIDWGIYLQDKRGFGSDDPAPMTRQQFSPSNYNTKRLHSFISAAAQLMTVILEEEAQGFTSILSLRKSEKNFGFSDGYVPIFCDDIDFLKDRRVTHITFSPHFANIVVACYDAGATSDADYLPAEVTRRWLICLWDIIVVSQPLKILVASAPVRSIIFDCLYSDLVYAGLSDGIICLWDLSEPDLDHDHCEHKNFKSILRSPTYCTFSMASDTTARHTSAVVELKSTCSSNTHEDGITPTTLFSMCEDGLIILWTVVRIQDSSLKQQRKADVRLSPWGRVYLSLTSIHRPKTSAPKDVQPHLEFTCMAIKERSVSSVLLGTNKGSVLQYPMVRLKTVIPKFGDTNIALKVTAIELCPHDPKCFLVGISDGSVRLHTEDVSRQLKTLVVPDLPPTAIVSLKWSTFKAGLIVSLDQNSNMLVWNICKSDLYPLVKMAFKVPDSREALLQKSMASNPSLGREELDRIVKFVLSTSGLQKSARMCRMDLSSDVRLPYLGVVVSDATIHVHRLNEEFAPKGADVKNDDLQILKSYLSLLHV